MSFKSITNTTGLTIPITEAGKDLAAGEVYTIYAVHYPMWAYAARAGSFLETKILAGDITVSDGLVPSLNATLGLGLLRDTIARDIPFDNRFNDFDSTNVQAAIEEAFDDGLMNRFQDTLALSTANTEYSYTFPSTTRLIAFKIRSGTAILRIYPATSSPTYETLASGAFYSVGKLKPGISRTYFFQTDVPTQVLEIEYWD